MTPTESARPTEANEYSPERSTPKISIWTKVSIRASRSAASCVAGAAGW